MPLVPRSERNLSNTAGQHKGCALEPLIRNLAGFVSLGPLQELMLPGGGSGQSWEGEAGCSMKGGTASPREGKERTVMSCQMSKE